MNYAIFDTETTGLSARDEVIQFSCLVTDEKFTVKTLYSFYCYTQVSISAGAFAQHRLDANKLMQLSNGKSFEDNLLELTSLIDMKDLIWVGYNLPFDIRLVNQTLTNNGLSALNFGDTITTLDQTNGIFNFDLMRALKRKSGRKHLKLAEAAQLLPLDSDSIESMFSTLIKLSRGCIANDKSSYHDANYDAMITWLLLYYYNAKLI